MKTVTIYIEDTVLVGNTRSMELVPGKKYICEYAGGYSGIIVIEDTLNLVSTPGAEFTDGELQIGYKEGYLCFKSRISKQLISKYQGPVFLIPESNQEKVFKVRIMVPESIVKKTT